MSNLPPLPEPFMELHREIVPIVYEAWAAQMRAYAEESVKQERQSYEWLRDWVLRDGKRSEIDPHGHVRETTAEIIDAAVAAAICQR